MADGNSRGSTIDQAQVIINRLFGVGLELNVLLCQANGPTEERLRQAIDTLDDAISDVRTMVVSRLSGERD